MSTSSKASTRPMTPGNIKSTEYQYLAVVQQDDGKGEVRVLRTDVLSAAGALRCQDALIQEIRRLARLDGVDPDETVV